MHKNNYQELYNNFLESGYNDLTEFIEKEYVNTMIIADNDYCRKLATLIGNKVMMNIQEG